MMATDGDADTPIRPPVSGDSASRVVRWFAHTTPERVALEVAGEHIDFATLNHDVDRLAARLLADAQSRAVVLPDPARDAASGDAARLTAGQAQEDSARMAAQLTAADARLGQPAVVLWLDALRPAITASLAANRAGMVTVPVDPTTPPSRVRAIVESVGAQAVLSDVDMSADLGAPTLDPLSDGVEPPAGGVERAAGPVAAIVFTSGSTGEPKGIVLPIEQLPVVSDQTLAAVSDDEQGRRLERDVVEERMRIGYLWAGTVGNADAHLQRLLLLGGTIAAYELRREGVGRLARWLARERVVSCLTLAPTVLRQLLSALPEGETFEHLRMVSLTGEAVTWEDVAALRAHLPDEALVYSAYGLTETNMISGMLIGAQTPLGEGPLPVGAPAPGREVTIVGPDGGELEPGEVGEIVVSAADIAFGYWRRPELTAAAFQTLPDGRRRMHTGDRGRLSDGVLEHLGRLDHMVKIAGNRVELGEIESLLRGLDGVAEAAARTYSDSAGALRLAAFVVALPRRVLDPASLRRQLAERLPSAMLPDHIEVLDTIPQLAGGKLDRQALPVPSFKRRSAPRGGAPSQPLEREVAAIWAEVLGLDQVGVEDDFFALGGDSLRAARVFAEVEVRLGLDHPISLILEAPTVGALAQAIERDASWSGLVPIQPHGSGAPLFVIHDQYGNLFPMRAMAEWLGEEQPVYGVRAPALGGGQVLGGQSVVGRMEDVATGYLAEIKKLFPSGPYMLYGHELGALIAFEMALQLQAAGERVGELAIGFMPAPRAAPATLKGKVRAKLRELRAGATRATRSSVGLPVDANRPVGLPTPEQRAELAQSAYREMAARYRPAARLHGSMMLVKPPTADDSDFGWGRYVDGEVKAVKLPALREALAQNKS
jgi:acyl-coenzyme A synthetase/AMP-(fatty) acid ligase/thioesterase domain-containing protein/acyl carrier protein